MADALSSYRYDPTIEDSYSVTRTIDGTSYHLSLTDTAGQEEYRALFASSSLSSADAFLLVYDITSPSSLSALQQFWAMIAAEVESREDDITREGKSNHWGKSNGAVAGARRKRGKPVVMVAGNKCDLSSSRAISSAEGLRWARERGCGFMETSARDRVNIEETFAITVRRVVEARRALDFPNSPATPIKPYRTPALSPSPIKEKGRPIGSLDLADRPEGNTRRGGWWAKLRCW